MLTVFEPLRRDVWTDHWSTYRVHGRPEMNAPTVLPTQVVRTRKESERGHGGTLFLPAYTRGQQCHPTSITEGETSWRSFASGQMKRTGRRVLMMLLQTDGTRSGEMGAGTEIRTRKELGAARRVCLRSDPASTRQRGRYGSPGQIKLGLDPACTA